MKLIDILREKEEGDKLSHNLEQIKEKAEHLLAKITETFPEYTIHDIRHSEKVLEKLDNVVIADSLKQEMNGYEIFFLRAGTYLHDIGMVDFPELIEKHREEFEELVKKEKLNEPEISDEEVKRRFIREHHHTRSKEYIVEYYKDLGIEDEHQARIIGKISEGHRKEDLSNKEFDSERVYKDATVNEPLLSAFLRIADELDLDFERAPPIIYDHIPPRDPISKEEWEKHLSISGVTLIPKNLTIKASAVCKNQKIHRALKRLETKIDRELEDLPNHLHQYREFRRDLPRRFLMEIEPEGYKPYDFKFTLRERKIFDLLMGEKLYKRKEECLRELLKNSVDACKYKRELLKKQRMSYDPKIIFELTPAKDKIIVTDSGVGMDEDIIERYFTKIGECFYESSEFLEKDVSFTPVSELGIGFLSCFMIANKIVIETKTDDSNPLLIEIDDVSNFFFVREGKRKETGTTVTLFLKDNIGDEIDIEKEIRFYARHLEFPVKVILPNRGEYIIEDQRFNPTFELMMRRDDKGELFKDVAEKYDFHSIKINNIYIEGIIAILLKRDEKFGLILPLKDLNSEPLTTDKFFISYEGIFVCESNINPLSYRPADPEAIPVEPEEAIGGILFIDLNFKRNALDINIARNDIVQNDKFKKVYNQLGGILISSFEEILSLIEQKAENNDIDSISATNSFFDVYLKNGIDDIGYIRWNCEDVLPNELLDLIRKFYYFKCIPNNDEIKYLRCDAILKKKRPIVFLEDLEEYNEDYLKQIISNCSEFKQNELYLLSGKLYAELLFEGIDSRSLLHFIVMERSNELEGIIPEDWKLVSFKNYKSTRFIEFSHRGDITTIVNRDNRFIDILIKGKQIITGAKKIAIQGFCRTLRADLILNFESLIEKQKEILKWFVEAGLICEEEINNYVLTKEDFPLHLC